MRFFMKVTFPVEAGNKAAKKGSLSKTIKSILDEQKPEAAYFVAMDGQRTALLFVDMKDTSEIPALAEPWFLALNASIEIQPAMAPEDLEKATKDMEKAVKKYG